MKKKVLVLLLSLALCVGLVGALGNDQAQASDITLRIDGRVVQSDVAPFILDGRTFVPLRFIAEALGEDVQWDGNTRTVYIG